MKEGEGPHAQLFLVLAEGSYYEFYSESWIGGGGRLYGGGLPAVLASGTPIQDVLVKC